MSHLDPDKSPDWNDDNDAFEQQLRALRPTPPTQNWSSMEESIDGLGTPFAERNELASRVAPASSVLRPVISHSLTAAIGLAVGVGLMLIQQSGNSTAIEPVETAEQGNAGIEVATAQPPAETLTADTDSQPRQRIKASPWRSHRFDDTYRNDANRLDRPLTAFGSINARLVRSNNWPKQREANELNQANEPTEDDGWLDRPDDMPVDQPVLSPRSLQLFLDDLTCAPDSDKPFFVAEDSRS